MTKTLEFETFFLLIVAAMISVFAVMVLRMPKHAPNVQLSLPAFVKNDAEITLTPTVTSPLPKVTTEVTTTSWTSSDGKSTISMKKTATKNVSSTYGFTITDTNGSRLLFVQTIPGVSDMSIPFNAFSPNNAYLFLKESLPDGVHFLIFKASGVAFSDGKLYEDVKPLFDSYTKQYALSDITGWADNTLLIVNTKRPDGSMGPSLWLDATTRHFIPLATLFE